MRPAIAYVTEQHAGSLVMRDRFCPGAATDGGNFGPDVVAALRALCQFRGDGGRLVSRDSANIEVAARGGAGESGENA
jgi:hypothetical protein